MESRIIRIDERHWDVSDTRQEWIDGLEAGKVLYFPQMPFELLPGEDKLLRPDIRDPNVRNISLNEQGVLKGAVGDQETIHALAKMVGRFREQAQSLVYSLAPKYKGHVRLAPTSFRPTEVATRAQSWRADDRRMHVDAFPSRPNYGERILRVFANVNPHGEPRVWRVGESFETIAKTFLPRAKKYHAWQAKLLNALHVTKSVRSEYDHLMLQLHDGMKSDMTYQKESDQIVMPFEAGSVWVCFSDQATHSVMSGQYMMEQTMHLAPESQYDPAKSPIAVLSEMTGRALV